MSTDIPGYTAEIRELFGKGGQVPATVVHEIAHRHGVYIGRGGNGDQPGWLTCPYCGANGGGGHGGYCPLGMVPAVANPYRSADAIRAHIDRDWQPVLLDLIELEQAGALAGIRAVISERLRQVRASWRFSGSVRGFFAEMDLHNPQELVIGAVLLADMAAEIDRQEANRGDDNG